ncbi:MULTISPECIES: 5'-methylthioadenosine/S-adenosylhomocysteine nucleosidase [unclassified Saccharopolyspora]|uniref:5'-methylthioadenosine/S-adenosylhomocysteine nucleosidase family protein n=1 Tax=unclassified Saccharopolyspora TaxID=2646250 RepID=UPI001CD281AF|nr:MULTISPECIES: 5'-methylthioadenosine/S-adenosylhomocysteine nucleosidase [unclassified Saccharopolyspora]MCA1185081.1 5'-methylthioadenosine/S-adenosylhomocysteine nucleosidase [Saccharopolyspora sp. 6T]MCA1191439.1 5'-methylthioadenosine/S-adenosylhomocysteine nucleosidase [Saccharopolyspora sp. 6V]MCA1224956.1 5'-methylthioadenosine/S-adenosylhomocysteine nucleosidase [Saccharopolyspora sp. 6M]MCA1278553.1 5'-methylthioadenosine/S-adenosylhomocysteine nucleosidase [Saccharopolyspora sp. 7B
MIVILTALDVEYTAVRAHLTGRSKHWSGKGTLFEVGELTSRPGREVAIAKLGQGTINAGVLTERAIDEFRPDALLFVGVAGALRDWLNLGDVVVANRVYGYHGGKSEDGGFRTRPRAWDIPHRIEQAVHQVSLSDDWCAGLTADGGVPAVHSAPIAAGDVVLNSRTSEYAERLRETYNDAIAVEMEGAGFALAGHINDNAQLAVVRAISDRADGKKESVDGEGWQATAARNAAAYAAALCAALEERGGRRRGRRPGPDSGPPPLGGPVVQGNAQVGEVATFSTGSRTINMGGRGGNS